VEIDYRFLVIKDLNGIPTDFLDIAFRIEFWGEPYNLLNYHNNNKASGTS